MCVQVREREQMYKWERSHSSLSLSLRSDIHHLYTILFNKSESVGPAHTQGEGIIMQGHEYQEMELTGNNNDDI